MYLGLEVMTLSTLLLVGGLRESLRGGEVTLKYYVISSLSSGVFLLGVLIIYWGTGSLEIALMNKGGLLGRELIQLSLLIKLGV